MMGIIYQLTPMAEHTIPVRKPPKNPTMANTKRPTTIVAEGRKRISYVEEVDTWEVLQALADRAGITTSDLIRQATAEFAEKNKGKAVLKLTSHRKTAVEYSVRGK